MFGYSPPGVREAATSANGAWPGTALPYPVSPEPSLELGCPPGWRAGVPSGRRFLGEIDLAATPAAVRPARSYIRALVGEYLGPDAIEPLTDLELLTSEAVTNAVVHAGPCPNGTIRLAALHTGRLVRVEVTDGGRARPGPPPPADPLAVSGRGLHLIRALAADHGTRHNTDGTATFWFGVAVSDGGRTP